ncbi:MAG: hypothetical protein ACOX8R_02665 [Bacillota bacterium]|jgi:hypothetical protein
MQITTYYNMSKPELTDSPDITVLSENFDIIDATLKALADGKAAASHGHAAGDITSGTLGVARGGTGKATHTSNAVLTGNGTGAVKNVATAAGAFFATAANGAPAFGTLPVAQGGTGATTAADALTSLGAAAASHGHAAGDITSGTLGVARGGTGKATHTSNAVLTGNGTGAVKNVATAAGAFFATAANGAPAFGTLPVAQGGTGATTAADALTSLGAAAASHGHAAGDITSGTLAADRLPTVPISKGGTGATTAAAALTALGAAASGHTHTVDTALSSSSTNPVQNKVINTALAGKAASSHTHAAGDITSGTLSAARGGTGQTTLVNAANALINALSTGDSAPVDSDYYVSQYASGGTTTTTFHRRPMSALWTYIKGKADSVYAAGSHSHAASAITSGTLAADRLPTVPISKGGTGATTAAAALTALGAAASGHTHTVDTALSSSSTNPVQNKVINTALAGKAASSHTHAAGDITSGTLPVARGGTGATTAAAALTALGAAASGHTHTVDTALSSTSTNPVQNKVINTALAGKAASSHTHAAGDITSGTLPVARGGTGLTSAPSVLTNLGSTTAASIFAASPRPGVTGTLPIANGGTGATTKAAALTSLGAAAASHSHVIPAITLYRSSVASVATTKNLTFNGSRQNVSGFFSAESGDSPNLYETIVIPKAGYYMISADIYITSAGSYAGGYPLMQITSGSAAIAEARFDSADQKVPFPATIYNLSAGAEIHVKTLGGVNMYYPSTLTVMYLGV